MLFSRQMRWFEAVLVCIILLGFYLYQSRIAPFHPDEADWIATSDAFEAFLTGGINAALWQESYWTLTQPPVSRYWTGLGRNLGGYRLKDLKTLWVDQETYGRINRFSTSNLTQRMLLWSRLAMVVLSALSAFIIFYLCFKVFGRLSGYLVALLFMGSNFFSQLLPRAMGEAPLLAAVMAAWFAGYRAVQSWEQAIWDSTPVRRRGIVRSLIWFGLMGFFCGIAGASKMNGASITLGAGLLAVATPLVRRGNGDKAFRLRFMILSGGLLAISAAIGFIGPNPYLYPDILGRTSRMLDNRFTEMEQQLQENPDDAISTPGERISAISFYVLQDSTVLRFPTGRFINLAFCLAGAAFIVIKVWKWLGDRRSPASESNVASVVTLAIAVTASAPVLFTLINWNRYYMVPTVFAMVCIAVGMTWTIKVLLSRLTRPVDTLWQPEHHQ
jgi:MFS family permease